MLTNDWWPWRADENRVLDVRGEIVCEAASREHAVLIAQAPQMLRTLKEVSDEPDACRSCGAEIGPFGVDLSVVSRAEGLSS